MFCRCTYLLDGSASLGRTRLGTNPPLLDGSVFLERIRLLWTNAVKGSSKDATYPAGFMDVITIEKTGENFRPVYDTKGRFTVQRIITEEAGYKPRNRRS